MRELNKFQIFTVAFLLMFIFVVGAIYTNTKEVAESKMQASQAVKNSETNTYYKYQKTLSESENEKIKNLSQRVGMLEERLNNYDKEGKEVTGIKCRIQGILDGDEVISLTQADAIQEAQYNGKELVMLCGFWCLDDLMYLML